MDRRGVKGGDLVFDGVTKGDYLLTVFLLPLPQRGREGV